MPADWKASSRTIRSYPLPILWPISIVAVACWLRWYRGYGDLSDEVSNRFFGFGAALLTVGVLILIVGALRGHPQIVLTNQGFTIRSFLSKRTYYWSDEYDFELREQQGVQSIIVRRRGSDEHDVIDVASYRESAENILMALKRRSEVRANDA